MLKTRVELRHHADQYLLLAELRALTDDVGRRHKVTAKVVEVALCDRQCNKLECARDTIFSAPPSGASEPIARTYQEGSVGRLFTQPGTA